MIDKIITESIKNHTAALESIDFDSIEQIIIEILNGISKGSTIFWLGNGGSASQANHLSAELLGGMYKKKINPFKSICLNNDTAFITAWSNDDSFDNVFERQLQALAKENDIAIFLSTSGNSKNLLKAADFANNNGIRIISFTGNDGGELKTKSHLNININSEVTQHIQEMHIFLGHIICEIIEKSN